MAEDRAIATLDDQPAPVADDMAVMINSVTGAVEITSHAALLRSVRGEFNVMAFGATGDGATDDTAAIQAALDAVNPVVGGTVFFPPPAVKYKTITPLVPQSNTALVGSRFGGTQYTISNLVSDVFDCSAATTSGLSVRDLSFVARGGDIFKFGFASNIHIERCLFNADVDYSATRVINQLLDSTIERCFFSQGSLVSPATVPTLWLVSDCNAMSLVRIRNCRFTYSGNYCIWIENTATGGYCSDNVIEGINFEQTEGGCIMLLSCFGTRIADSAVYDLTNPTNKDVISVGRVDASHQMSRDTLISKFYRRGGSLGGGLVDIRLQSGVAPSTTIELCNAGTLSGFAIDWGVNGACSGRGLASGTFVHTNIYQGFATPRPNASGGVVLSGAGSPEGAITAPLGTLYARTDGAYSTSLYQKANGTGNTGWQALPSVLQGSAALDFGNIVTGTAATLTITLAGALTGNHVTVTPPAGLDAGLILTAWVSASSTVTVRLFNATAADINPASGTFVAQVTKT